RRLTSWAAGNALGGERRQGPHTGRGCRPVGTAGGGCGHMTSRRRRVVYRSLSDNSRLNGLPEIFRVRSVRSKPSTDGGRAAKSLSSSLTTWFLRRCVTGHSHNLMTSPTPAADG